MKRPIHKVHVKNQNVPDVDDIRHKTLGCQCAPSDSEFTPQTSVTKPSRNQMVRHNSNS